MFSHAASPKRIAEQGYRAMMRGKALCYCGSFTKTACIGARLLPRIATRKFAKYMNK